MVAFLLECEPLVQSCFLLLLFFLFPLAFNTLSSRIVLPLSLLPSDETSLPVSGKDKLPLSMMLSLLHFAMGMVCSRRRAA